MTHLSLSLSMKHFFKNASELLENPQEMFPRYHLERENDMKKGFLGTIYRERMIYLVSSNSQPHTFYCSITKSIQELAQLVEIGPTNYF